MYEWLKNAFSQVLTWFKNIVRKVINGVLEFAQQVVGYFRNLNLKPQIHVPFMANLDSFKQELKNVPVKKVGIFQGVFNEQTNEFEHINQVEADSLDQKTKEVLGREELVVLS